MKRFLLLGLIGFVLCLFGTGSVEAAVNDFKISNYTIDYHLMQNAEGRSELLTTETVVAQFDIPNQNHGIERAIPRDYDKHSTGLHIISIVDEKNNPLHYSTRSENGYTIVRIGDADKYVQGTKTYVITYSQQDVTKYFSNTNDDEFYWDTNGTEWRVPISQLKVHLEVDASLANKLTGAAACYQGILQSTGQCTLTRTNNDFEVSASDLSFSDNVTIAVGFKPHTFAEYKPTTTDRLKNMLLISSLIGIPLSSIIMLFIGLKYSRSSERTKERKVIVTEFLPPKDTSVTASANVIKGARSVFTAQLLDFAVRHYIKIYQTKEKSLFRSADYDIEIVKDISNLHPEEQEILTDLFNGAPQVGQRLAMKTLKNNTALYNRIVDNDRKLKKLVRGEYALRQKIPEESRWFKRAALVLVVLTVVLLCLPLLWVALAAFIMSFTLWPLTDKGVELARYLDGLKQYISVAEKDRLQALQSPEGADKVGGINTEDPAQLVKLYERVLPYATLFGQEKEWNKQLGQYYESLGQSPDWYSGHSAFNAAAFTAGMSSFSSSASYSSASSSSSGGSSGGGFSGGGGGGGGGGGW